MRRRLGSSTGLRVLAAFGLLAVSAVGWPVDAGQLGHYFPGSFNIRDYIMPDKGDSQWPVTEDSGGDVSRFNGNQDQVHGIGAQLGYAIPAWRLAVTAKHVYEYYAESRFRGQVGTLSIAYQF